MITTFKPAHDMMLIRHIDADEATTSGGIVLPGHREDEHLARGVVLVLGPGRLTPRGKRAPMSARVDDLVVYPAGSYREITLDGVDLRLISDAALLGGVELRLVSDAALLGIEEREQESTT